MPKMLLAQSIKAYLTTPENTIYDMSEYNLWLISNRLVFDDNMSRTPFNYLKGARAAFI